MRFSVFRNLPNYFNHNSKCSIKKTACRISTGIPETSSEDDGVRTGTEGFDDRNSKNWDRFNCQKRCCCIR